MSDVRSRMLRLLEAFDASVLGYTASELAHMDDDERAEAMRDAINRIADLADAAGDAFKADLSAADRAALKQVATSMAKVARKLAPIP
jgi:hypothetical protein